MGFNPFKTQSLKKLERGGVTPMKHFPIGDDQKRISCPDHYLADREDDETIVIWDPENADIPIRATVLTISPKDPSQNDAAFWWVIDEAREKGITPMSEGGMSIYRYREPSGEAETFLHFTQVGLDNHLCIFSITVSGSDETTPLFQQIAADLAGMIRTLVVRKADEQFTCALFESEREQIAETVETLLDSKRDEAWDKLQRHLDRAYRDNDEKLAQAVGLAFGELMRGEVPSLDWAIKVDEFGTGYALDLTGTTISIFPQDMIVKRFDQREALNLKELSVGTVETLERIFRELHEG